MKNYAELLQDILDNGEPVLDRTEVGTLAVFGRQLRFDLRDTFPLLTGKKLHIKSIVGELLWFLTGDHMVSTLQGSGIKIWDNWAYNGSVGKMYGVQWRSWGTADGRTIDQLGDVIEQIKTSPASRRLLVSAWNVGELDQMALPPCHVMFQFHVDSQRRLSCHVYQRSGDVFLGVPFNIASYALLTCMVAHVCGLQRGELIHSFGNVHLYSNHVDAAREYLSREVRPLPRLKIRDRGAAQSISNFSAADFEFVDYNPHPSIYAQVAV